MSSNAGRTVFNWKGPFGATVRCLLVLGYERDGLTGLSVTDWVLWKIPTFYELFRAEQSAEKRPLVISNVCPTKNAIHQRQHKSLFYQNEHPRYNDRMGQGLELADTLYYRRLPISHPEMLKLLEVYGTSNPSNIVGYCYIAKEQCSEEKCKPGFTINLVGRLSSIQTSEPVGYYAWLVFKHSRQAHDVEQAVLRFYVDKALQGEWRQVPPVDALAKACKFADDMGYDYEVIMNDARIEEFE
jgi:hypothetical protein